MTISGWEPGRPILITAFGNTGRRTSKYNGGQSACTMIISIRWPTGNSRRGAGRGGVVDILLGNFPELEICATSAKRPGRQTQQQILFRDGGGVGFAGRLVALGGG